MMRTVQFIFTRVLVIARYLLAFLLSAILLFAYFPVFYTGVMLERQLTAWWQQDPSYQRRHQWVALDEISPHLLQAVVAAEDQKFLSHQGFDFDEIEKVLDAKKGKKIRGASTISQQTAKNVFLWTGRSWFRKGLESGITVLVEAVWGKPRILEVYLNSIEFGPGIFGAQAAAKHYFGISAAKLTPRQAAALAVVLPSPHRYSVLKPTAYLKQRQQWVLRQMRQLALVQKQLN